MSKRSGSGKYSGSRFAALVPKSRGPAGMSRSRHRRALGFVELLGGAEGGLRIGRIAEEARHPVVQPIVVDVGDSDDLGDDPEREMSREILNQLRRIQHLATKRLDTARGPR
jgi:hypothetical protein